MFPLKSLWLAFSGCILIGGSLALVAAQDSTDLIDSLQRKYQTPPADTLDRGPGWQDTINGMRPRPDTMTQPDQADTAGDGAMTDTGGAALPCPCPCPNGEADTTWPENGDTLNGEPYPKDGTPEPDSQNVSPNGTDTIPAPAQDTITPNTPR